MKILSITAGAAGMYCGSCFRDNALAAELMARGHEVTLVPVYTPTRTDEPNVSQRRVLFGGISVYLQQYSSVFRVTPRWLDRLWDSPSFISMFAGRGVSTDARLLGDLTISMLQGEHGVLEKEFDKLVEWIRGEPLPDVVNLPNSLLIGMARPLGAATGRPICCTLQGEELFLNGLQAPYRDRAIALIREQVAHVDRFIAVSDYCATFMADLFAIPHAKIAVVPLGIRMDGYQRARRLVRGVLRRLFRARRARKGLARPRRKLCPPAASNGAGAGAPGRCRLHGRRPDVVSERRCAAFSRAPVSTASSPIEARSIATASCRF